MISVPSYGFNPVSAGAALLGIIVMLAVAAVFISIIDGSRLVRGPVRFFAGWFRADPDVVTRSIRTFGEQLESLVDNRPLIARLTSWASANWLLDALSTWVFLRALGVSMNPIGLLVVFGVANVLAAIAVTSYRVAQFLFPIVLGGLSYASLTVESFIEQRRRLASHGTV